MATSLTTRETAGTGATVKGSPLTSAEVDNNFLSLNDNKSEIATTTEKTSATGASIVPSGTTAERPAGSAKYFRYNEDTASFEGYDGTEWGAIAGGGSITLASTPPESPNVGDTWINSADGVKYTYIEDTDSSQWIELEADIVISGGSSGIALTDLSVSTAAASGSGALSYNNTSGEFTFTPADTSGGGGGSAYSAQYMLSGSTSDANETEIFIDGISNSRISVSIDTTIMFTIDFIASGSSDYAASHVKGTVRNTGGTVSNLGSLYEVVVTTSNAGILFDARADDTNNSLGIYVQGLASTALDYKAVVSVIEV